MYVEKNQGYRPTKHARTEKTNNEETAMNNFYKPCKINAMALSGPANFRHGHFKPCYFLLMPFFGIVKMLQKLEH